MYKYIFLTELNDPAINVSRRARSKHVDKDLPVIRLVTLRQYIHTYLLSLPASRFLFGAIAETFSLSAIRFLAVQERPFSLCLHVVARDERDEERRIILWFHRGTRVTLPGASKSAGAPRFVPPLGQIAPSRIYPGSDSNFSFAGIYSKSMITSHRLSSTFLHTSARFA